MNTISILGCGWLGLPLATTLISKGFVVKGSTTSQNKLPILESQQIEPFLISLNESGIEGDISGFLKNSEMLIIDIPPKTGSSDFVRKMQNLIPKISKSPIKEVLFISSISVYGDDEKFVDETTQTLPLTENGKQLVASELLLQQNQPFRTTIVRFGGLIGEARHPIKHLAGKKEVENPNAPVNLIHQKDCIGIILKILEQRAFGETFNAVSPHHPSREAYYVQKAIRLDLVPPQFKSSESTGGKIISSDKILNTLGYTFLVPDL